VPKLRRIARALGGTLVVESARELKPQIDVWGPAGDDFEIMRKLKETWDPKGILSPGRFVGGL
jgi:glycolate oxidase FAD binding subunit